MSYPQPAQSSYLISIKKPTQEEMNNRMHNMAGNHVIMMTESHNPDGLDPMKDIRQMRSRIWVSTNFFFLLQNIHFKTESKADQHHLNNGDKPEVEIDRG